MPDSGLQHVIDGVRARLQAELDAQLAALTEGQGAALAQAREEADREAEQRWSARVEATRQEWSARLASEVESVRAEAERRLVTESMRVRLEAEQAAAEAAAAARADLEHRLAEERQRAEEAIEAQRTAAEARIDAEREAAEARLEAERAAAQARIDAERDRALAGIEREREHAERALAEAQFAREPEYGRHGSPTAADSTGLLDGITAIDEARSLSDVLGRTASAASAHAPRAAVFVLNGPQLEEWRQPDREALANGVVRIQAPAAGVLGEAALRRTTAITGHGIGAPAFASLDPSRQALAVPLLVGDEVVGALYADAGQDGPAETGWAGTVQILARHASARMALLTAVRTAEAVRLMRSHGRGRPPEDGEQAARRYARLLLSEIKLYNEAAVQAGREKRDLLRRLEPEVDRARRLYGERIPASTPGRDACFQQELVQTLADGDASLLG